MLCCRSSMFCEARGADDVASALDLPVRKVDAEKRRIRQGICHRDEVPAAAAAEFQHAASLDRRGFQSEHRRDGREEVRMRLRIGAVGIGECFVKRVPVGCVGGVVRHVRLGCDTNHIARAAIVGTRATINKWAVVLPRRDRSSTTVRVSSVEIRTVAKAHGPAWQNSRAGPSRLRPLTSNLPIPHSAFSIQHFPHSTPFRAIVSI